MSSYMKLRDLRLQILDFPGQLEEYVSHSLFAQDSEALFCLVVDISAPIASVAERSSAWCSFIGGISAQRPSVILAVTHLDRVAEVEHEGLIENLLKFLKNGHSNISVIGCARVNYRADRIIDCVKDMKLLLFNTLQRSLRGRFIPKSYIIAQEQLQRRESRHDFQIVSFAAVRKLLVQKVPEFHDNHEFLVRVLKFLHSSGTIVYHQSNNFIALEPYTWFASILSLLMPESEKQMLIRHENGLMKFSDILQHYALFRCKKSDVKRIMDLLCDYNICVRAPMVSVGYVFPSLLPTISVKLFQRYWCASPQHGERFVGREVTCKNALDSISRGLFCSLQVRLNNEALCEHKGAESILGKNIVIIRVEKNMIKVALKRKSGTLKASSMEITARGPSPPRLLFSTTRTIMHHLHRFAPNLEMLWSAVCPCCMLSSRQQYCLFPMKVVEKKLSAAKIESKQQTYGVDISSHCQRCARTELCLEHRNRYMHHGMPNIVLSANEILNGMLFSDDTNKKGGL